MTSSGLGDDRLDGFGGVSGNDALNGNLGFDTCTADLGDSELAGEA